MKSNKAFKPKGLKEWDRLVYHAHGKDYEGFVFEVYGTDWFIEDDNRVNFPTSYLNERWEIDGLPDTYVKKVSRLDEVSKTHVILWERKEDEN